MAIDDRSAGSRPPRRRLDGVLLLDKPAGLTSNAALQQAKRLFSAEKAGHTGSLDPMATGLLPLCFGEATKFSRFLLDADKSYSAVLRLGETTTTGDAEGTVLQVRGTEVVRADIEAAAAGFRGESLQLPPMHSALKHEGRALYTYARKGIDIEREERPIRIDDIAVVDVQGSDVTIAVRCSKGTYIRTLAEDIGEKLGCGAHLVALRRTGVASFSVAEAVSLDQLAVQTPAERDSALLPLDCLVAALPACQCSDAQAAALKFGQIVLLSAPSTVGLVALRGPDAAFFGVGEVAHDAVLRVVRLVTTDSATNRTPL